MEELEGCRTLPNGNFSFPPLQHWGGCRAPTFSGLVPFSKQLEIYGDFCDNETIIIQAFRPAVEDNPQTFDKAGQHLKIFSNISYFKSEKGPLTLEIDSEMVAVFCKERGNWLVRNNYNSELEKKKKKIQSTKFHSKPPNVHIMVLDSTSRFGFFQRMNETTFVIEELEHLTGGKTKAFQFLRHNIVGGTTIINIPQLLGGCPRNRRKSFTYCPDGLWLPDYLKDLGYITGEATTFKAPVWSHADHRMDFRRDMGLTGGQNSWESINETIRFHLTLPSPLSHCLGGVVLETLLFNYSQQFHKNYANSPHFMFNHFMVGHEETQNGQRYIDKELAEYLATVDLSETFLFILGDHGLGYGEYRNTLYGQHDFFNPIFIMLAPSKYLTAEEESNLRMNEQKLTSHWDIYHTVLKLPWKHMKKPPTLPQKYQGGIPPHSFNLLEEIPRGRTCKDANIYPEFCQCGSWVAADASDKLKETMLGKVISSVNEFGFERDKESCLLLKNEHFFVRDIFTTPSKTTYHVVVEAKKDPSSGRVQSVLAFVGYIEKEGNEFVVSDAKRLTPYNSEPCKTPSDVSEYCICKEGNEFAD